MKKENKKKAMDVVFILDRSGSMQGLEEDTIGGFNSYINENKNKNYNITTVLFDDKYELIHDQVPIKKIKKLTKKDYYVRGCTALLDAVGKTISYLDSRNPEKVLFMITTDGYENASKEFTKEMVKNIINKHKNYEFMYIGADIDSFGEGTSIGIRKENIASFKKDKRGVKNLFGAMAKASVMYEENCCLSDSWKEELQ